MIHHFTTFLFLYLFKNMERTFHCFIHTVSPLLKSSSSLLVTFKYKTYSQTFIFTNKLFLLLIKFLICFLHFKSFSDRNRNSITHNRNSIFIYFLHILQIHKKHTMNSYKTNPFQFRF